MNTVTQALANYFDSMKFVHFPAKGAAVECLLTSDTGHWRCCCAPLDEPVERLMIMHLAPLNVPLPRRARCLELLNLINRRLLQGNFEMNPGTGEVRYRDCLPLRNGELDAEQFHNAMAYGYNTFSHHLPVIIMVVFAGRKPVRALEMLDGEDDPVPVSAAGLRANLN